MSQELAKEFLGNRDIDALTRVLEWLRNVDESDQHRGFVIKELVSMLEHIRRRSDLYAKKCSLAKTSYENQIAAGCDAVINQEGKEFSDSIYHLFIYAYRLVCELSIYADFDGFDPIHRVIERVQGNVDAFPARYRNALISSACLLPAEIVRNVLRQPVVDKLMQLDKNIYLFEDVAERSDVKLKDLRDSLSDMEGRIKKLQTATNFLELDQGFEALRQKKTSDATLSLIVLACLAGFLIAVPLAELIFIFINIDEIAKKVSTYLAIALPTLAIELLLVYFFRVVLSDYKSVKAQLLQIDLRRTLCQFIQGYVDYSKVVKEKDKSALDKFENLIFSGIAADEQKIPSTFDGMEQVAKLIEAVTGKR